MQIVIEIPEEVYNEAKASGLPCMYDELVASAVGEGTPLSEVLDDIKGEIKAIQPSWYENAGRHNAIEGVLKIIDKHISRKESYNGTR